MLLTNIGDVFRKARMKKGLTQFQVAEMANLDEKHYSRIERNECYNFTINTFLQICYALNIKAGTLVNKIQIH